jgi:uncharacterized membrane protein YbhN (UPF0104 family)
MAAPGSAAAIDLGDQIDAFGEAAERFFEELSGIAWGWLTLALVMSLGLHVCRAHAWANALRAAYPGDRVSERGVVGAFLVGVGLNGILPARGGDAVKIVLAKRSVRGSRYPAVISSFAVLAPFDSGIGLLVLIYAITQGLLPAAPELPDLAAFDISFWAANPDLLLLALTILGIGLVVLYVFVARRAETVWKRLVQGVAILREPRRYLREVVAWQLVAWFIRFASFWFFLEAFGIGGSAENVLLVMSVLAISGALPLTPGGAGAQQALLVATLEGASRVAVLSYSVGQQLAVTAWTAVVAFIALGIVFRTGDWRGLVREGKAARADKPEATEQPAG